MQKIRDISEDEMIAVYLQTEFHSSRFRQDIAAHLQKEGIDPHLLQAPDWQNGQENALRRTPFIKGRTAVKSGPSQS